MTHPNPVVTNSGVPEVEQEFEVQVAQHLARLSEERPVNEPVKQPVTPAEERTGVSDVRAAVAQEVEAVRRLANAYGLACEDFGAAREASDLASRNEALRAMRAVKANLAERLDRIEQWTRGEQR
jgi:hypothetical protein